ncbi:MAG: enoyl-CoA hydratase/isomerase family protein [Spirochaetes bacterium]|nr:enoyl-CoA hydratase/isomerase family protein [Spirochaetota bacterium]
MRTEAILTMQEGWAEILLQTDPPDKPPTIDFSLLDQLETHVGRLEEEPSCRALLIKSSSSKYFVVGANLEALKQITLERIPIWIERGHKVFNRIESLPFPTIALVEGYALGGGLELCMACDLIYASQGARLGQPEAGLGFIPGWGGCIRLAERIGWAKAKELIYTGRIVEAEEAYSIGLVDFLGTPVQLEEKVRSSLEAIKKNSSVSITMAKKILNARIMGNRAQGVLDETMASVVCMATGDTEKRLKEFFEKRR